MQKPSRSCLGLPVTEIPVVRRAMPDDEDELMKLCRLLHEENGIFSMSEDRVRSTIRLAFDHRGGMIGVIGEPSKIQAMICLIIGNFWYSDELHLEELFSYVHPDYRKSTNADALVRFAQKCSDEIPLPLVIGILSHSRTIAKVRLYKRRLGNPIGAFFVHGATSNGLQAVDPWTVEKHQKTRVLAKAS